MFPYVVYTPWGIRVKTCLVVSLLSDTLVVTASEELGVLTEWMRLLAGAVAFGATIVATMVADRQLHLPGMLVAVAALMVAVGGVGAISSSYATTEAVALALFFLFTGVVGGYWIAAAALPLLAYTETPPPLEPRAVEPAFPGSIAVLLLATAEPDRYDPRAVATTQRMLVESQALSIPATAAPFIFLSEKARYRMIGGMLPAHASADALAQKLQDTLTKDSRIGSVGAASCTSRPTLAEAVRQAYASGAQRVIVAPLGSDESFPVGLAKRALEELRPQSVGLDVNFTVSLWHSTRLAARLCERIVTVTRGVDLAAVGVVLVGEGQPPSWTAMHPGWSEQENYFAQRVRLHLADQGVRENHVRIGWLEWQLPDVTEAVRHLAALGCTRIVVAPGLIPLPSLATAIDLDHAVRLARLNETVSVVTLTPWGDDDAVVDVLADNIRTLLSES
jgi:protoheme ferro-lyase